MQSHVSLYLHCLVGSQGSVQVVVADRHIYNPGRLLCRVVKVVVVADSLDVQVVSNSSR